MPPKVILECKDCKDRISVLPDDLLVQILLFLPSPNRRRSDHHDPILQLHYAPILESLGIQLGKQCPVDTDVGKLHVVEPLHSHGSKVFKLHLRFSEYWLEPLRTLPLEHMINAGFLG
ncbi:hypothetical protein F2Q68_00038701 [Brassica cretica]|uniref:Uncharacterized protein n=1 Tax=Brassica cretica TaxID=69181 RepID=A0A8S9MJG0_BRACR|nr:hypothetical protein F2Q68_00038701 [Brassica cretica]